MTSRGTAARTLLIAVATLGVLMTSGCAGAWLSEEGPEPEDAPLEVVVKSTDGHSCVLNRAEVGAGNHIVSVISEGGAASVRILTRDGDVVYQQDAQAAPVAEGSEDAPDFVLAGEGGDGSATLVAGTYSVECSADGTVSSAPLHVAPARPGHESMTPPE